MPISHTKLTLILYNSCTAPFSDSSSEDDSVAVKKESKVGEIIAHYGFIIILVHIIIISCYKAMPCESVIHA